MPVAVCGIGPLRHPHVPTPYQVLARMLTLGWPADERRLPEPGVFSLAPGQSVSSAPQRQPSRRRRVPQRPISGQSYFKSRVKLPRARTILPAVGGISRFGRPHARLPPHATGASCASRLRVIV